MSVAIGSVEAQIDSMLGSDVHGVVPEESEGAEVPAPTSSPGPGSLFTGAGTTLKNKTRGHGWIVVIALGLLAFAFFSAKG